MTSTISKHPHPQHQSPVTGGSTTSTTLMKAKEREERAQDSELSAFGTNLTCDSAGRARGATPPRPSRSIDSNNPNTSSSSNGVTTMNTSDLPQQTAALPPQQQMKRSSSSRRSSSPNRIPRIPHKMTDGTASNTSSPRRFSNKESHSLASSGPGSAGGQPAALPATAPATKDWQWVSSRNNEPGEHEQALFEQRLCEDTYGVAVRKINQSGKPNLRYVKCMTVESDCSSLAESQPVHGASSTRSSISSLGRSFRKSPTGATLSSVTDSLQNRPARRTRVLTWGKKKDVRLPLDRFVCVRKGKTTDRARRNPSPSCRLLSLITTDPDHPSLDIEAPTKLDRDKFARAFARFLEVPLVEDKNAGASQSVSPQSQQPRNYRPLLSTAKSEPDLATTPKQTIADTKRMVEQTERITLQQQQYQSRAPLPVVMAGSGNQQQSALAVEQINQDVQQPQQQQPFFTNSFTSTVSFNPAAEMTIKDTIEKIETRNTINNTSVVQMHHDESPKVHISSLPPSLRDSEQSTTQAATASRPTNTEHDDHDHGDDAHSQVSSLTGAGFDQEIVEELHQALTELKAELEESRAEAARAVKVAEQAIQSAENSNSNDWNSTVTHKAAEAAALAQKRSAEAMAKQRLAEERLEGERRTAVFWRRQAEAAEEEAGALQTRAAAAEVQRAAMAEELECERRKSAQLLASLKARYASNEVQQKHALEGALEKSRALELELAGTRRDLVVRHNEAKALEENVSLSNSNDLHRGSGNRMKLGIMGRKKKSSSSTEMKEIGSPKLVSNVRIQNSVTSDGSGIADPVTADYLVKLHAEAEELRKQLDLLRKVTADELRQLPEDAKFWAGQASQAVAAAQEEISLLRGKLALERATRRKLLHEVQDLRGSVRVYCRPRACRVGTKGMLSIPSQETLLLHPFEDDSPMSFKFDRVFSTDVQQREVYNEIEELCLSVLDGYKICLMAHGQTGTGKTHSILGDVKYSKQGNEGHDLAVEIENQGIHLKTVHQLFSIAEHRNERYQDVFTLNIVEVHNERLCDLLAGTEIAESRGQVYMEDTKGNSRRTKRGMSDDGSSDAAPLLSNSHSVSSKQGSTMTKLEIRTNHNGDTVVQGLTSVEVNSFEDVYNVWTQCLAQRASRLAEQGVDIAEYEAESHVIATLSVVSVNVATGIGSVGKIKFVDLAGADLVPKRGVDPKKGSTPESPSDKNDEWKYSNRSLATLNEVVHCRSQFMRSVPYRNSTLTHLLRDNLEADTKVLLLLCVSSDPNDLQETACALRFASTMRRVTIGKATKHSLTRG